MGEIDQSTALRKEALEQQPMEQLRLEEQGKMLVSAATEELHVESAVKRQKIARSDPLQDIGNFCRRIMTEEQEERKAERDNNQKMQKLSCQLCTNAQQSNDLLRFITILLHRHAG